MHAPLNGILNCTQSFQQHQDNGNLPAGVDLQTLPDINQPCYAIEAGKVVLVGTDNIRGSKYIQINGATGAFFYVHLDSFSVSVGDSVTEGQSIGTCGTSGNVAPHLHVGLIKDGVWTDPAPYILTKKPMWQLETKNGVVEYATQDEIFNAWLIDPAQIVRKYGEDITDIFFSVKSWKDASDTKDTSIKALQSTIDTLNTQIASLKLDTSNLMIDNLELKKQITILGQKNAALQSELDSYKPFIFNLFYKL